MRRSPRFALSSLLLGTGFMAFALAVALNFGAFVLLLSALATLVLLLFLVVIDLVRWRWHNSILAKPVFKLMMAYCLFVALYFASYGPATWLLATTHTYESRSPRMVALHYRLYSPVTRCIVDSPVRTIRNLGVGYLNWWLPSNVELLYRGRSIDLVSHSKLKPASAVVYGLEAPLIPGSG